ncbi:MAG: hypothetical protein M1814_003984 [Vezdaea aestivalis]|nr:MAG: hypothetical protein M1814_003984 [Vezdaea aestivalis]
MDSIEHFKLSIPEQRLEELHNRLELARFPEEIDDAGWTYGSPAADIRRLVEYWKTKFDWRAQEAKLNGLPHFKTSIPVKGFDDVNVHYIHQKHPADSAIPLLFLHGWPGSFIEVTKILPLLSSPQSSGPVFSIVAPSLPNFGFSSRVKKQGFGLPQHAECVNNLMHKLGYPEYVVQAGDWGMGISRALAAKFSSSCKAYHLNTIVAFPPPFTTMPIQTVKHLVTPYTAKEKEGLKRSRHVRKEGSGYYKEQSTRPATLGFSLSDSPVGLLAWIYEKLVEWTDSYPWTEDEILTWVSIYWFSEAGPAAASYLYYEANHTSEPIAKEYLGWIGGSKIGISYFPQEMFVPPKSWGRSLGPVVFESENDHGGHFGAWEVPDVIARDVKAMYGKGGGAFGLIRGKSGYAEPSSRL